MVREKRGSAFRGWKFPTGLSHLGEDLSNVVVREVREETGVLAQFTGILAIRQQHDHPGAFGRSDLLAICRLQLVDQSSNLSHIEMCHKELSDCAWIPLTKLLSAHVHSVITDLDAQFLSSPEQLHVTTLTQEIVRLITASSPMELRPHRLESVKQDKLTALNTDAAYKAHLEPSQRLSFAGDRSGCMESSASVLKFINWSVTGVDESLVVASTATKEETMESLDIAEQVVTDADMLEADLALEESLTVGTVSNILNYMTVVLRFCVGTGVYPFLQ
ncbi:uncharacterized protein DEA37_0005304, partial [Paragonimus westermani]